MGISASELMLLLVIAVVIFGTKRLRNLGTDLGGAIKSFRNAIADSENSGTSTNGNNENNRSDDADSNHENK